MQGDNAMGNSGPQEPTDSRPARDAGAARGATASGYPPQRTVHTATALDATVPSLRFMIGLVIAALVVAGLYFGRTLLVPLALAFLLSFVLEPLVAQLKRMGLPRLPSVIAVATKPGLTVITRRELRTYFCRIPDSQAVKPALAAP